jgi:hypothetical protein
MYRKWKKIEFPKKSIVYEFGINKNKRRPRNRWQDEVTEGRKNSWWRRVAGKSI